MPTAIIPLKQGLRHFFFEIYVELSDFDCYYSTKTRIKTFLRLKLLFRFVLTAIIPLKQGLFDHDH